ncbi:hypothetical protein IHE45_04G030900 [Dioscorea alata]|uniref:Uncharacterized protein n=1 Tax=Dioscorea alata TaxID=55571 RepID=A0ACB7WB56_DIOAL|nr:hypothetical protein IHE45_04G030900 [Dioscorea alata]
MEVEKLRALIGLNENRGKEVGVAAFDLSQTSTICYGWSARAGG